MSIVNSSALTFCYSGSEEKALCDVTLSIHEGECVCLCGRSGCGKTTFTHMLNGLSPDFFKGELTGECITAGLKAGSSPVEEYVPLVGSVFQNPKTQYFNIDTTAELAFPCENTGMEAEKIRERIKEIAGSFQLEGLLDRSIFKLSGGEKQQIAFGAASILFPKILVLDEPTSNLDAGAILRLREMILFMKNKGTTIVIAEHRLAWLGGVADRYLYFEGGKLLKNWDADEFLSLPSDELKKRGLRARNLQPYQRLVVEKSAIPSSNGKKAVETKDLVIGYDKKNPVRKIPDFSISSGEIVGLMGHNGAGKSTFARTLCGLLKPLGGKIMMNGKVLSGKALTRRCFMVMQDVNYQLFSDSVREEVLLGASHPENCERILESLGLSEFADRHPMSLSGGQKQRVVVAAALLSGKDLILLDEPTSGLDYYHMMQTGALLQELKKSGAAVLIITHDEELAGEWCDRILRFDEG